MNDFVTICEARATPPPASTRPREANSGAVTLSALAWQWFNRTVLWHVDLLELIEFYVKRIYRSIAASLGPSLTPGSLQSGWGRGSPGLAIWSMRVLSPACERMRTALAKRWKEMAEDALSLHLEMMTNWVPTIKAEGVGPMREAEEEAAGLFVPMPAAYWTELIREFGYTHYIRDLSDDLRVRLERTLARAMTEGVDMDRAARMLQATLDVGAARARVIARTEIMRAANSASRRIYERNRDVLQGLMYVATLDDRTCLVCGVDDGAVWYYEREPGIDEAPPLPRHPNCRCIYVPVTKTWEELLGRTTGPGAAQIARFAPALRASMFGPVTGSVRYPDWLQSQPVSLQKRVLGQRRWELWQRAGVPLEFFVASGRLLTVAELLQLYGGLVRRAENRLGRPLILPRGEEPQEN